MESPEYMSSVPVGITISRDLFDRIEKKRGLVSRSRFIASLVEKSLDTTEGTSRKEAAQRE
jgi:metal-responsive CopG/Arc/MetJ family transcriptional regulator